MLIVLKYSVPATTRAIVVCRANIRGGRCVRWTSLKYDSDLHQSCEDRKKTPSSPRFSKQQMQTDENTIDEKTKDVIIMGDIMVITDGSPPSPAPSHQKVTENKETKKLRELLGKLLWELVKKIRNNFFIHFL